MRVHLALGVAALLVIAGWIVLQGGSGPVPEQRNGERNAIWLRDDFFEREALAAEFTPAGGSEAHFKFISIRGVGWSWIWLGSYGDEVLTGVVGTSSESYLVVNNACYFPLYSTEVPIIPGLTQEGSLLAALPRLNDQGNYEYRLRVPGETEIMVEEDLRVASRGQLTVRTAGTAPAAYAGTYTIREATATERESTLRQIAAARPSAFGVLELESRFLNESGGTSTVNRHRLLVPRDCSDRVFEITRPAIVQRPGRTFLWPVPPEPQIVWDGEISVRGVRPLAIPFDARSEDVFRAARAAADDEVVLKPGRAYAMPRGERGLTVYRVISWRPDADRY
jgi:hypothetical protein